MDLIYFCDQKYNQSRLKKDFEDYPYYTENEVLESLISLFDKRNRYFNNVIRGIGLQCVVVDENRNIIRDIENYDNRCFGIKIIENSTRINVELSDSRFNYDRSRPGFSFPKVGQIITSIGKGDKRINLQDIFREKTTKQAIEQIQDYFSRGTNGVYCTVTDNPEGEVEEMVRCNNAHNQTSILVRDNEGFITLEEFLKQHSFAILMEYLARSYQEEKQSKLQSSPNVVQHTRFVRNQYHEKENIGSDIDTVPNTAFPPPSKLSHNARFVRGDSTKPTVLEGLGKEFPPLSIVPKARYQRLFVLGSAPMKQA